MTEPEVDSITLRAQDRLGTVLASKYRLDAVLGVGGMAVVYRATHRNGAEFAVKLLHPELSMRDDLRNRFLREGRATNAVKHPGVVAVVDDDVAEDGAAFIVMERLRGAPVEKLWQRRGRRLPVWAVLSIGEQLLDVLASAHEHGIVHRDIKPANLFSTCNGTLKVLDFGVARVRDVATGLSSEAGALATSAGFLLGTPAFMSPEQALGEQAAIDAQSDLWAVGATLFSLLSGQLVHVGETAAQLMIAAATAHARPLSSVMADVPASVAAVIDKALQFEKAERWADAAAMRDAVVQAARESFGGEPTNDSLATLVRELAPEAFKSDPPVETKSSTRLDTPSGSSTPSKVVTRPTIPRARSSGPNALLVEDPSILSLATQALPTDAPDATRSRGEYGPRRRQWVLPASAGAVALIAAVALARLASRHDAPAPLGTSAETNGRAEPRAAGTPSAASPPTPAPRAETQGNETRPIATVAERIAPPSPPGSTGGARSPQPVSGTSPPKAPPASASTPRTPPPGPQASSVAVPVASSKPAPKCTVATNYDSEGMPHFTKVCE